MVSKVKKYFITGLVILLPLAMTLAIIVWMFNLLTVPFVGLTRAFFERFDLLNDGFLFFSAKEVQEFTGRLLILGLLFFFTVLLGMFARWFFFTYLFNLWNSAINRIPLVRSIYKTSQDVIGTLFTTQNKAFKQVALVPFPSPTTFTIGLVTRENLPSPQNDPEVKYVAVFVPTTPNPTSGFLVLFKEQDIRYLDMSVESALKYIISCGVIATPFKSLSKSEATVLNQEDDSDVAGEG